MVPDHRQSVYDNVPDHQQLLGSDADGTGGGTDPLEEQDVLSALDGVLERISRLQQLVSSWAQSLHEEERQRGSSSSSLSQDSSAASPCPSSPSHIHVEEEEEEEVGGSTAQATRSQRSR